ncbi:MAG: LPXTG cell wall anchor domain-containing protein [Bacillota bacterium]|nr:LPXTG cell wall anchor domain-containing protein [Bacillota bacterium]
MKKIKTVSMLLAYVFILTLLPMGFISQQVEAAQVQSGSNDYSKNYQLLNYHIFNGALYKDTAVLITSNGVYYGKDGQDPKKISETSGNDEYIGSNGSKIYLYSMGNIKSIDIDTLETKIMCVPSNYDLIDGKVDKNGDLWFSIMTYGSGGGEYYIMKMNGNSNKDYSFLRLNNVPAPAYNLSVDNNNNLWFNPGNAYKLGKISTVNNSLQQTIYKSPMQTVPLFSRYKIDNSGNIWVTNNWKIGSGDVTISKLTVNGDSIQVANTYTRDNGVYLPGQLSIDNSGNVWYMGNPYNGDSPSDGCKITACKLEGDKFVPKYRFLNGFYNFTVNDDNHMLAYETQYAVDGYAIVNRNSDEKPVPSSLQTNSTQQGDTVIVTPSNVNNIDADAAVEINPAIPSGTNNVKVDIPVGKIINGIGSAIIHGNDSTIEIPYCALDLANYYSAIYSATLEIGQSVNAGNYRSLLQKTPAGCKSLGKVFSFTIDAVSNGSVVGSIHQFTNGQKVKVTINLTNEDLQGVDTSKLSAFYFDETTGSWVEISGGVYDAATKTYSFYTTHFSNFTLMQTGVTTASSQTGSNSNTSTNAASTSTTTLPKTGSAVDMNALIFAGLAAIVLGTCLLVRRKEKAQ